MPDWKEEVRKRLSGLKLAPAHEAEIVEELAQHLEEVYERSLKSGATEAEAKRAALRELAGDDLLQNEMQRSQKPVREAPVLGASGRSNLLTDFLHDLRYAATHAAEESGLHDRRCHCVGSGHRREHRHLQCREHRVAAPAALQRS